VLFFLSFFSLKWKTNLLFFLRREIVSSPLHDRAFSSPSSKATKTLFLGVVPWWWKTRFSASAIDELSRLSLIPSDPKRFPSFKREIVSACFFPMEKMRLFLRYCFSFLPPLEYIVLSVFLLTRDHKDSRLLLPPVKMLRNFPLTPRTLLAAFFFSPSTRR